jgi:hypothetical protein
METAITGFRLRTSVSLGMLAQYELTTEECEKCCKFKMPR